MNDDATSGKLESPANHAQRDFVAALHDHRFAVKSFRFLPSPPSAEFTISVDGGLAAVVLRPRSRKRSDWKTRLFALSCEAGDLGADRLEPLMARLRERILDWESIHASSFDPAVFFTASAPVTGASPAVQAGADESVDSTNFPHSPRELYHLQIGVTYACQCRCAHCAVSDQSRRGDLLTVEEIVDLCRQAREDLNARVVELFGGEPLVRRDLARIVEGCGRYLDVWMSSNALGFTRRQALDLKRKGLKRCFFSLDSCRREKHDRNRNRPGCFDAVMRALDYCEEAGIEANFSTCASADLVISDELEELIAFTKRSKAHRLRLVLPKMMGRLHMDESILLKVDEIEKIRRITAREEVAYVEAEGNYAGRIEKCFCLRGHVYVNPYGTVQPCVYTTMDFGNVRDHPLKFLYERLFNHEVFRDKSILNLCLLQNPAFVRRYLAGVSRENPVVPVALDEDTLRERVPESIELMDDDRRARVYAAATHVEPFLEFVDMFRTAFHAGSLRGAALDIGCGQGEITLPFAKAHPHCRVDGVDGAESMVGQAVRKLPAALKRRVRFFTRRLPKDRMPASNYDIVVSNSLLHHLPDPMMLWDAVKRSAARGARVFVRDLRRPPTRREAARLVDEYSKGLDRVIVEDFRNSLLAAYTVDEVAAQLARAGLARMRVEPHGELHLVVSGLMP